MPPALTSQQRVDIIALHERGLRISDISKRLGISRKTVYFWVNRLEESGSLEVRRRQNYQRSTTEEQDAEIVATHLNNPNQSTRATSIQFNVSVETVRRRIKEAQMKKEMKDKKPAPPPKPKVYRRKQMRIKKEKYESMQEPDPSATVLSKYGVTKSDIPERRKYQSKVPSTDSLWCGVCRVELRASALVYACVQCRGTVLCVKCERALAHRDHCLLRAPTRRVYNKIKDLFATLKMEILDKLTLGEEEEENNGPLFEPTYPIVEMDYTANVSNPTNITRMDIQTNQMDSVNSNADLCQQMNTAAAMHKDHTMSYTCNPMDPTVSNMRANTLESITDLSYTALTGAMQEPVPQLPPSKRYRDLDGPWELTGPPKPDPRQTNRHMLVKKEMSCEGKQQV